MVRCSKRGLKSVSNSSSLAIRSALQGMELKLSIFGTVLSAPAPPVSLSLSGRNWVLLLLLLGCLTKLMLRPLSADGKVHKAIKQVHHLGKQPKEGGDDAAEKPKKNVNHSQLDLTKLMLR